MSIDLNSLSPFFKFEGKANSLTIHFNMDLNAPEKEILIKMIVDALITYEKVYLSLSKLNR